MALHIIAVRMIPDAPTNAPAMISPLLLMTKPVIAAAKPEYELSNAITTGMSAPPIGITESTPRTSERPTNSINICGLGNHPDR